MKRRSRTRAVIDLLGMIGLETLVLVLLLGASKSMGSVPLGHLSIWVERTSPQEALTAMARLLGIVVSGWLLTSTLFYAGALITKRPGLLRLSRPLILPALRKLLDAVATASVAASSIGAFAGSASASALVHPPATVQAHARDGRNSNSSAEAPRTAGSTAPAVERDIGRHLPHPGAVQHRLPGRPTVGMSTAVVVPSVSNGFAGLAPGTKVIVVQPGDCLSVLAERHLGDWRLDQEIEQLNRGRLQADGRRLEGDHWIYPGWVLIMPGDSTGTLVVASHHRDGVAPSRSHAHPGPSPDAETTVHAPHWAKPGPPIKAPTTTAPANRPAPTPTPRQSRPTPPPRGHAPEYHRAEGHGHDSAAVGELTVALAGLGAVVGGVIVWKIDKLRRAARHSRPSGHVLAANSSAVQAAERRARAVAHVDATAWVDAAVRYLSGLVEARSLDGGGPVPSLVSVQVGPPGVKVVLSAKVTEALGWFSPTPDGQGLLLDPEIDLKELEALAADRWPAWPALVAIGVNDEGSTVLVNLEHLGSLAIEAPSEQEAVALLASLALQLVSQPWGEEMLAGLHVIGPSPLHPCAELQFAIDTEEAMALAEKLDGIAAAHQEMAGALSISTLRAVASEALPHVVVVFPGADNSAVQCLIEAAAPETSAVAIVTAAPGSGSAYRLAIDTTGNASLGRRGQSDYEITGIKVNNPAQEVPLLSEAIGSARCTTPSNLTAPGDDPPRGDAMIDIRAVTDENAASDKAAVAAPAEAGEIVAGRGAVEISFLGPVELNGGELGAVEVGRQKAALALISYLAAHPRMVTVEEIATALWPLDASKENLAGPQRKTVMNVISRARALLGYRQGGGERLVYSLKGYRLAEDVTSDWARFEELLRMARRQSPSSAAVTLRTALELVRDEPFAGAISSQFFEWVASEHLDFTISARVVDAAEDLAEIALTAGDCETVMWAVSKGLQLEPTREELFRLWMHAFGKTGRPARVDDVYRRLKLVLRQRVHPLQEPQPESREVWRKYTAVELATNLYD